MDGDGLLHKVRQVVIKWGPASTLFYLSLPTVAVKHSGAAPRPRSQSLSMPRQPDVSLATFSDAGYLQGYGSSPQAWVRNIVVFSTLN